MAAFMEASLYHPDFGYYARAVQRSGRTGDFFTSVDVGPLFGQLLAKQVAEMATVIGHLKVRPTADGAPIFKSAIPNFDLVEAGGGNGRLSTDILLALKRNYAETYAATRLHLVEVGEAARTVHRETLGETADRLASSSATLPEHFEGVLIANELLDAMPVHQLVMRESGLREIYVESHGRELRLVEGPLSTPRLAEYFSNLEISLEPGWTTEVSLVAVDWIRDATRRLTRGFMILIDYGHEARELYSVTHSTGTLTSFSQHRSRGPEVVAVPWLRDPGTQDLTAHVDFTSVRRAAESEGCQTLGFLDQMYFLVALAHDDLEAFDMKERLAFKTLVVPGGLGTTMKVMVLGKKVGAPALTGLSSPGRVT